MGQLLGTVSRSWGKKPSGSTSTPGLDRDYHSLASKRPDERTRTVPSRVDGLLALLPHTGHGRHGNFQAMLTSNGLSILTLPWPRDGALVTHSSGTQGLWHSKDVR